jgi:L-lactate dehydrogenase complex protein LldG
MADSTAKSRFLDRISKQLGRPRPKQVAAPRWEEHPWDPLEQGKTAVDWLAQFRENFEAAGGETVLVPDRDALRRQIREDLAAEGRKNLILWQEEGLSSLVDGARLEHVAEWDPALSTDERVQRAERADVGLVRAEWGIAFSGTIVLWNGRGRGRSVSLLPSALLAVLPANRILPRMEPVLRWIQDQDNTPSCVNFISGPSRTSDIENDLSIGVHGPGAIKVYILEEE